MNNGKHYKLLAYMSAATLSLLLIGCVDSGEYHDSVHTDSDTVTSTDAVSITDTEHPSDSEFITDTIAETETESETKTETETETDIETEAPSPPEPKGTLTSLALLREHNPSLAHDIEFKISEDDLTATLTLDYRYYADSATLSAAVITAEADNGCVTFPTVTADGCVDLFTVSYCTVTDNDGGEKVYKLKLDRTVYSLPIVNITLADGVSVDSIDREITTKMTFSLDAEGADGYESVGVVSGKIRGRGNSTWKWDKKPYKIKLDKQQSLLGLKANKDYILLSNYADKSLIRNTLAYELGRVLDHIFWSPHQYPVDLFINGEYRGVYSLGEHMEVAKGRVNIEESAAVDTGYLIEIGGVPASGYQNGIDYFHTPNRLVSFAGFVSPSVEDITEAQKEFISDYFAKAEAAIIAGEGYEEYIDVDSFVDWILIHELSYNLDSCFRRSCYITKEPGGKLTMGPIWDFDLAFGNLSRDNKNYDDLITVGSDEEDAYVKENWCTYLLDDPEFCQKLIARWGEKRDEVLTVAMEVIDRYSELIYPSQEENFRVWDIWGIRAGYQSKWCAAADSYPEQIEYLKNFLTKRAAWMNENLPTGTVKKDTTDTEDTQS